MMSSLKASIEGVGLIGPGINNWAEGRQILANPRDYVTQATVYPLPQRLPPNERRRTGQVVKLSLAVGLGAVEQAGLDAANLPLVMASSGGDNYNCHAICETLAAEDRHISPTRFHNSVTNAPAGYWSIAMRSMAPATVVCAYDGSFSAGLLEAVSQVSDAQRACLLLAYDTDYPEPLRSLRPIPDGFGVALVLAPRPSPEALAYLELSLSTAQVDVMQNTELEKLRRTIPAARCLPLLSAVIGGVTRRVVLEYLDTMQLAVQVSVAGSDKTPIQS